MSTPTSPRSTTQQLQHLFPSSSRIPLNYCDGPTQRLYAVSAYVALQALKLSYWLELFHSVYAAEENGFILWLLIDIAFIMALYYLRIPWMELPPVRLAIAVVAAAIMNYVLFIISPTAIARLSADKDQDEHLLGIHTVLIKPYSSAVLNPDGKSFCVPDPSISKTDMPEIPIMFKGSDPHKMEYTITSFENAKRTEQKLWGPFKESSPILHRTRTKQEGGLSLYTLKASVVGSYKLEKILDKDGVIIRFHQDKEVHVVGCPPTAAFQCDAAIELVEGESVDLPIHLTGSTPWYLTYGMEGQDALSAAVSDSRNALVTVRKPGIYQLHSVSDVFCDGDIMEQARICEVIYSKRPRMNLMIDSIRFRGGPRENVPEGEIAPSERISREADHFVLPAVCKDADRTLELRLTGKAPFELRYRRIYKPARGGKEEVRFLVETSQHSTMRLPIMTDQSGTVNYQFDFLSDATYRDVEILHEKQAVVFKHIVRAPPVATLLNTAKQFYCKNEITGVKEKIAIRIEDGVGPYALVIEIMRPNQAVAEKLFEHDIVPRNGIYEWTLPAKFTDMGLYKVSIIRATDTNLCSSGAISTVEFDILDTPSITPLRSITDACVGDKTEFSVQGQTPPYVFFCALLRLFARFKPISTPTDLFPYHLTPWDVTEMLNRFKVYYSVDTRYYTATLESNDSLFTYETHKPGLFTISKVCQTLTKKKCCTQPIEEMSTMIWAIPTVKVADGTNFIMDIHEGEQAEVVVKFVGEAPFTWTYIRTEAVRHKEKNHHKDNKRRKVLEERTVEGIDQDRYTFMTSSEGTIVPVWIKDKHCQHGIEM